MAFLKGAVRLNPPAQVMHTQWDLQMVLNSLRSAPYEPLEQADIKSLSMKTAFLLAITSTRRVGELHALSMSPQCLRWGPEYNQVTLWPNPVFQPKVLSDRFVNQTIQLAAFNHEEASQTAMCPVRALRQYVLKTASWCTTDQLFVRFGACRKGSPLSKQRLSHWVVDTIVQAYGSADQTVPASIKYHSTRAVAISWAALRSTLSEICAAATWASPCTFTRFYRINVAPIPWVSSAVLSGSI